jgi:predicted transcriptional regulator
MDSEIYNSRTEKLSLLIGTVVGQISELLNTVRTIEPNRDYIYRSLLDIHSAAALQIHELYYKGNKP